ncbi:MAG: helix-turn-helix domain-containing protein [Verrucomicrobiota bacterium]
MAMAAEGEHADRSVASLQTYAFLLEWWRENSHPAAGVESSVTRAMRFCREHFREPLGVKELAHEAGMSREHFSRIFAAHTGETPTAFLRRLRLEEAGVLLRDTRLPLHEVAMRSGFYSARHLMRTFQRVHGTAPSQVRQRGRT